MPERGDTVPADGNSQSSDAHPSPTRPEGVPLPLVARMVARLVSRRPTAAADIPALVETVNAALAQILHPAAEPPPVVEHPVEVHLAHRKVRQMRTRRSDGSRTSERSRTAAPPAPVEAPALPPAPRLVRRSDAIVSVPVHESAPLAPPASSLVRGVVRWFDPQRQTGGLRLTGVPDDVAVEPAVFAAAGVTRLFKGQEIEAELDRSEGRVRVMALKVPGGPGMAPTVSGPIAALGGRRPRVVVVEKKRDALRRVAARTEAEQLLGPAGPPKFPR